MPQLKARLRENDQLVGGTKGALIQRIKECVVFGCLPRCPKCGGEIPVVFLWSDCRGGAYSLDLILGIFTCTHTLIAGGKLKPHKVAGMFKCPGYMDDDQVGWLAISLPACESLPRAHAHLAHLSLKT